MNNILAGLLFSAFFLLACERSKLVSPIGVDGSALVTPTRMSNPEADLLALRDIVSPGTEGEEDFQDLFYILEAQVAEKKRDHKLALSLWFKALNFAEGEFGNLAFEGWVKSFAKDIGETRNSKALAY